MIYRGPGFLAVRMLFGFSSIPSPPPPVRKLDRRYTGRLRKRGNLLTGEVGIIRRPERLVLYKSFNTLCIWPQKILRKSILHNVVPYIKKSFSD
jgi:hypothetical protein